MKGTSLFAKSYPLSMISDTVQLWLVKSILHSRIEWKNRLHTNVTGLLQSTRANNLLAFLLRYSKREENTLKEG